MRMKSSKLLYGNKGIVFTMDVVVGMIVALSFLTAAYLYMNKSVNDFPSLSILRTGDDIISVMDHDQTIQSLNVDQIRTKIDSIIPNSYDYYINITSSSGQNVSFGSNIPNDRFVSSGKRYSIGTTENSTTYITTRYWMWLE